MHRHRKQLTGRLESCWQDHAPWADSPTHPITKHVISKMQPQPHYRSQTMGEILGSNADLPINDSWTRYGLSAGLVRALRLTRRASRAPAIVAHSLCHADCWQCHNLRERGGKTTRSLWITVLQWTETDPVRASQHQFSAAHHHQHTLPITLCLFLTSSFHQLRQPLLDEALLCGVHVTLIWQNPINTSLLYIPSVLHAVSAPSLTCFVAHIWPAVWCSTQPVISYWYSWLKCHTSIYYGLICKWLI